MIQETLRNIVDSAVGIIDYYSNTLNISGWILQEPKYDVSEHGFESCYFIIHQPKLTNKNEVFDNTFVINVIGKNNVARLKEEVKTASFIIILGKIKWSYKIRAYTLCLTDFKVASHLDTPLESTYEKGDKVW